MGQYAWVVWIGLIVLFSVIEASTVNLVTIWFIIGSLVAMAASLLGASVWLQITLCLVIAAALLLCLRPFVRKYVTPKRTATNLDMILGREAYIHDPVDNLRGTGSLKLDGKEWTVRSITNENLPEGTLVKIVKLEGVKLFVAPVHTTAGL